MQDLVPEGGKKKILIVGLIAPFLEPGPLLIKDRPDVFWSFFFYVLRKALISFTEYFRQIIRKSFFAISASTRSFDADTVSGFSTNFVFTS